ncbi:AraC family transcriptional regulator [Pseudolysobacter antarcticus]|uniref:AraC family transcriptional regulator n=1 Tax=Pseudolysobacter antarcticus TaxID=2511995 RepID=A0A411HL98_9GAMM|nr:AraC family transcriptional regulator [Pseudolysobacter antarcticus]QBB71295.1 AraC family transcriptional regulator [Pseudolysobacter antarcticus]
MSSSVGNARGVLRHASAAGAFEHARIAPDASLRDFIEHFWMVRWDLRGHTPQLQETLPHPNVHIVFEREKTRIFGVHTARFSKLLEGQGCAFGVKFRPGGFYPFLQRPLSTIADGSISLQDVFGSTADTLENEVFANTDVSGMIAVATQFLRAHAPPADPNADRIAAIVARIVDDRSLTSVDDLASRNGLNKRSLQRLFKQYVGVSPKWVINRYRLHDAIELLASGETIDGPRLALELGYFDQAHFIRDFKKLIGRSPADYRRVAGSAKS